MFHVNVDQQIGQLLQRDLLYSYQDFARDVTVACNLSAKLTAIPVAVSYHDHHHHYFIYLFMFKLFNLFAVSNTNLWSNSTKLY